VLSAPGDYLEFIFVGFFIDSLRGLQVERGVKDYGSLDVGLSDGSIYVICGNLKRKYRHPQKIKAG
jgi:hypothetical protein